MGIRETIKKHIRILQEYIESIIHSVIKIIRSIKNSDPIQLNEHTKNMGLATPITEGEEELDSMQLLSRLEALIEDEETGADKYSDLAKLAVEQVGVAEDTKLLIAETFMGIKADEEKHKQLLKFIYSILQEV